MNISCNWLKEYLATDVSADETAKMLTSIGLEVGAVNKVESIKGGLQGLVVGQVLTCVDHPNSDHLHITTVDIAKEEPLQIVCGAPNVAAGQKVIVATVGTTLYFGEKSIVIKPSKIRGVESFGMICAEDEIGTGTSHDGILVLPPDTPTGLDAGTYFNVHDDYVIEVDITPNRADAVSHYGVARDLAASFAANGVHVPLTKPSVERYAEQIDVAPPVTVEVVDTEACLRYTGVSVCGITVGESPKWLKERLQVIGLRPINTVVDITNYVMHAFGQPLHAYDAAKITGHKIVVKRAADGMPFVTLDGVERKLSASDLMICNAEHPMCLAGVFGGIDSGVTAGTVDIFLESAYFNPVTVRQSARRYGLNTDSSFRFERGADPSITLYALRYAALLIVDLCGGEIVGSAIDHYPQPVNDFQVTVSLPKIYALIGQVIPVAVIETIFHALEITVLSKTEDEYHLQVPAYRVDVQRDVDVIEEILRLYGYNRIEVDSSVRSTLSYTPRPDVITLQQTISEQLTANGFNEIINNSLTKGDYYANLTTFPAQQSVKLMNALSNDLNVMRQTLLFGGLESISYNINRQSADLKFYEFGNCYCYQKENADGEQPLKPYIETLHLALWMTGNRNALSWQRAPEPVTFYELKAHVQNVLQRLGLEASQWTVEAFSDDLLSEALRYTAASGETLAVAGTVNGAVLRRFELKQPVFYADLFWKPLMKLAAKRIIRFHDMPKFPEVKRDLALLIDKRISFDDIERVARTTERKLLKRVTLFDVYEGKNLEAGKKSYAVNFILQDTEKTLTDKQIDNTMQRLIKSFETQLGARLR
ncbi:MAG: phenylalanine--tRNA ligase subunit beta [Prevotellaceae bacterium]|jgi:phenylalanyl-tRNA synthetase beta chain|nr:phenylalanine--tRNA ligase subunit beta [Prevotellaceae bacterium]